MLPKFLYGNYKRYKADTTTFVEWLVDTAKKCGHIATVTEPPTTTGKTSSREKSKTATQLPKYTISLKELGRLAQTVAKSAIDVPPVVLATVKRAISLRKRCATWFSTSQKSADTENESHSYFIKVLEELCETLEWKKPAHAAPASTASTNPDENGSPEKESHDPELLALISNPFGALSLQEAEDVEESTKRHSPAVERRLVDIDEENPDSENPYSLLFFHLFCLFEDLQNMRQFVSQTVAEYVDSKIDLANLAVVADTAVHLSKQLIDEASSTWSHIPELKDEQRLQQFIYLAACTFRGKHWEARPDPEIPYNIEMEDVADWCYLPTSILLASFRPILQPKQLPICKKGYFGTYNPKANRDRMTPSQRFNEDKIVLLELLPEFTLLQQFKVDPPVKDEITIGLINFVENKRIPVWLTFATQILLDVHHGLRHTNSKAFNDLRLLSLRTNKTIDEYWELSGTFTSKPKFWPKEGDDTLEGVQDAVRAWIADDAIYQFKKYSLPWNIQAKLQVAGGIDKHFLLRSHGILCGLIAFNFTLNMQNTGLALINQWYDVVQMAYLYNLGQQAVVTSIRWPDMDVFIDLHGAEHMFIGGRPKTADESVKKLQIATGISNASDFARGTRSTHRAVAAAQNSVRLMEPSVAIKNIFQNRYLMHGTSKLSVTNADQLVKEISSDDLTKSLPDKQLSTISGLHVIHRRWANTHSLGALQLLAAIKQGLYAEEPRLQFNYFGMHKRCIDLLRRIQAKEDHKFRQYFGPNYMPDDTFISNTVLLVLTVAQRSAIASQQMGISAAVSDGAITSRIVMSSAEVMKEYLGDNGDKACKELKTFCKNKSLAEGNGPQIEAKEHAYWFSLEEVIDPASLAALQTGIKMA